MSAPRRRLRKCKDATRAQRTAAALEGARRAGIQLAAGRCQACWHWPDRAPCTVRAHRPLPARAHPMLDAGRWHVGTNYTMRRLPAPGHPLLLQVRNAASLLFTALLVRVLGFRNHAGKVGCSSWALPGPAVPAAD